MSLKCKKVLQFKTILRDPAATPDEIAACINGLNSIDVDFQTLKETKIGLVLNNLTKTHRLDPTVDKVRTDLVAKWRNTAKFARAIATRKKESRIAPSKRKVSAMDIPSRPPPSKRRRKRRRGHDEDDAPPKKRRRSQARNSRVVTTVPINDFFIAQLQIKQGENMNEFGRGLPSLMEICWNAIKRNPVDCGPLPFEMQENILLDLVSNLNERDLERFCKKNPTLAPHVEPVWKKIATSKGPCTEKPSNMTWRSYIKNFATLRASKLKNLAMTLKQQQNTETGSRHSAVQLSQEQATILKSRQRRRIRQSQNARRWGKPQSKHQKVMSKMKEQNRMRKMMLNPLGKK